MSPRDALRAGDVRQALDLLKAEVRRAPREAALRTFLFQLFCITGAWDRALTQLALAGELDPAADPMVRTYEVLIRCEIVRERVFAGRRTPTILGEPGPWLPMLVEAVRLLGLGEPNRAAVLRDAAFDAAPATQATLDGTDVPWVADADPRLGPTVEAIVEGRYVWVPFERIRTLAIEPPQDLRDQVWMPARFTWTNAGEAAGFIPTRYPGTAASDDPTLLLARRTTFAEHGAWSLPLGQRILVSDDAEAALMDLRRLDLRPAVADLARDQVPATA